jgi:hypothetical protein
MRVHMKHTKIYCIGIPLLLGSIYFIFPIPHTIVLRNLLLLVLIGMAIMLSRNVDTHAAAVPGRHALQQRELQALAILTGWLLLTLLWAVDKAFSFDNYLSEWLGSLFVAWVGYMLAGKLSIHDPRGCANRLVTPIVLALFVHGLWMLLYQIWLYPKGASFPVGSTPFGDYSTLSTSINIAFALLLADAASRRLNGQRLFPWPNGISIALLTLSIVCAAAAKARNGIIVVLALLVVSTIALLWKKRKHSQFRRHLGTAAITMLIAAGLVASSLTSDERWGDFTESINAAYDTKNNRGWLHGEKGPVLSNGQIADHSAYMRIAWGKVAIEGIIHKPLGYGYGLGGFGRCLEEHYGRYGVVSSHSGILDFALANGIPGLLLLLVFVALLFRRSWLSWLSGNPWGLALMLSLANYFFRILLDGHFGGYRLKMIALLLGILYWLALGKPQQRDV